MKKSVFLVGAAICLKAALAGTDCKSPEMASAFLAYGSGSRAFSSEDVRATFTPVVGCLQRWVEDGGEVDGLPLQEWAKGFPSARVVYKAKAMELIDALVLMEAIGRGPDLAAWIRTSVGDWSGPVKWNAWKTLADLHDPEAVPLLRAEAASAVGIERTFAWEQLARLSPETAATDFETIAKSDQDYKTLGFTLLSAKGPAVIPALRRLIQLDPSRADRYAQRIKELERLGNGVDAPIGIDDGGFRGN